MQPSGALLRALRRRWFESSTSVVNGPFPVNIVPTEKDLT